MANQEHLKDKKVVEIAERAQQRGIYLLPNLLTTAALFAGFYSVVASMKGLYELAAITILIAMIADGMDGRVARLTNTQTPFGAQFDSLSDLVAFGVAPALALYSWSLAHLGKLGWLAAFLYVAATALRLARFNTQVSDKLYFQGMPCTFAGGFVACVVWMGASYHLSGPSLAVPVALLAITVAALMVSTIRYSSFKSLDFKGRVPFLTVVLMVFMIAGIAWMPREILFGIFFTYFFSGPVLTLWQVRKRRKQRGGDHKKA